MNRMLITFGNDVTIEQVIEAVKHLSVPPTVILAKIEQKGEEASPLLIAIRKIVREEIDR